MTSNSFKITTPLEGLGLNYEQTFYEFDHQVAGQVPMLSNLNGQIAKLGTKQEIDIYHIIQTLPRASQEIFCKFMGETEIDWEVYSSGNKM